MLLAIDIGNSNIKAALFEDLEQKTYFRISCDRNKSSDEYGVTLLSMLRHAGYSPKDVTGIVFSSVVPFPLIFSVPVQPPAFMKITTDCNPAGIVAVTEEPC